MGQNKADAFGWLAETPRAGRTAVTYRVSAERKLRWLLDLISTLSRETDEAAPA
jgi:hypothetical protein